MAKNINNKNLNKAKDSKKDEFYTQLSDIEMEMKHYKNHFKDKVVYCNCDDPRVSNFVHFFLYNFNELGLKKLIATCYKNQNVDLFNNHQLQKAVYLEYSGGEFPALEEINIKHLSGDGDFRSKECIDFLKQADIVVTNPPFSLFREYVAQLMEYGKKFVIIGHQTAISYKQIFKFFKENKIWCGYHNVKKFMMPEHLKHNSTLVENEIRYAVFGNICWYTNLDIQKQYQDLVLYKNFNEMEYIKYDNYDAIEVSKIANIPIDYRGVMAVPISFFNKYNPDQFEIIGIMDRENSSDLRIKKYDKSEVANACDLNRSGVLKINGEYKSVYTRLLIKNKKL